MRMSGERVSNPLSLTIAQGLALVTGVALLFLPAVIETDESGESTGETQTLVEWIGPSVLVILAAPFVLTLLPLLFSAERRLLATFVCTALLAIGVLFTLATVGIYFLPALAAMGVACARTKRPRPASQPG